MCNETTISLVQRRILGSCACTVQYPNVGNTEYTRTRHDIEYLDICSVIIDNDPVIVSIINSKFIYPGLGEFPYCCFNLNFKYGWSWKCEIWPSRLSREPSCPVRQSQQNVAILWEKARRHQGSSIWKLYMISCQRRFSIQVSKLFGKDNMLQYL